MTSNHAKTAIDLDALETELLTEKPTLRLQQSRALIAELRASRRVVDAARITLQSPTLAFPALRAAVEAFDNRE